MEFLGIGYQEVLVILVVLLVVVGPERMPRMAYQMGKWVRTLQEYARAVRDEFHDEFDYIEEQYRTVKGEVETASNEFRAEQSRFNTELRQLNTELKDVTEPLRLPAANESSTDNVVDISTAPSAAAHGVAATTAVAEPEAAGGGELEPVKAEEKPAPPLVF
jgi:sec-independent protein translocase protein TatB